MELPDILAREMERQRNVWNRGVGAELDDGDDPNIANFQGEEPDELYMGQANTDVGGGDDDEDLVCNFDHNWHTPAHDMEGDNKPIENFLSTFTALNRTHEAQRHAVTIDHRNLLNEQQKLD